MVGGRGWRRRGGVAATGGVGRWCGRAAVARGLV